MLEGFLFSLVLADRFCRSDTGQGVFRGCFDFLRVKYLIILLAVLVFSSWLRLSYPVLVIVQTD